jgi:hypothetical protein
MISEDILNGIMEDGQVTFEALMWGEKRW